MSGQSRSSRPLRATLCSALVTGALVALWLAFAPVSVGGDFSYAVIRGNSMEPGLTNGDVVFLRREAHYGIGDAVAYRDPILGAVLHRIVARDGERFALRGDARETNDVYEPLPGDVIGRKIGVWPGGLAVIMALTSPASSMLTAAAVFACGVGWTLRTRARGQSRWRGSPHALSRARR